MVLYFALDDGSIIEEYPLTESFHRMEKINVDQGAIKLDRADHHADKTHLLLKGDLANDEKYISMQTQAGVVLASIDHEGKFHGAGITAPELTSINSTLDDVVDVLAQINLDVDTNETAIENLETDVQQNTQQVALIASHEDDLTGATHLNTGGELVKRDSSGDVHFNTVTTELAAIGNNISLYGDAAMNFVPQSIVNGSPVNKPDFLYRFGRNTEELGDLSGTGDGLELKNGDTYNEILIQVNDNTPTIQIAYEKLAEPVIRFTENDTITIDMDDSGYHRLVVKEEATVTAGATTTLNLRDNVTAFELQLSGNMLANDDTHIHLTKTVSGDLFQYSYRFEVAAVDVTHDVYIKRVTRKHDSDMITVKIHLKSTDTIPNNTILHLICVEDTHLL